MCSYFQNSLLLLLLILCHAFILKDWFILSDYLYLFSIIAKNFNIWYPVLLVLASSEQCCRLKLYLTFTRHRDPQFLVCACMWQDIVCDTFKEHTVACCHLKICTSLVMPSHTLCSQLQLSEFPRGA